MNTSAPQPPFAVQVEDLVKTYAQSEALKSISFNVAHNELFGIIGPDGGGKTTLFRILTSLMLPTSGNALTYGYDVQKDYKEIRKIIGYMPGQFSLYQDLTVEENLQFFARIFGASISENYELIAEIYDHIKPFKDRRAGDLSGGMKQKLALSCALIHYPKILFLDEPTTGIDAVSRMELWSMLKSLKKKGVTIIVSTPYMDEALLCDRILLMQEGSILDSNTPKGIINNFQKQIVAIETHNNKESIKGLRRLPYLDSVHTFGYEIHATSTETIDTPQLKNDLEKMGYQDINVRNIEPTIEDCFMDLMQNNESHG
ncbi:MAG TPA: ABC transporter ATP-binding protein [Saprospiraceae bacterium]|nr:ABC transporter ATP-binding protein [Saprospiraceae bacterium]